MKEGWKYRKLGEVATFSRGLTYSKKDEADYSDNIVLRSNNVDLASGKLILDELKYLKSDFIIPEDKYVKKGSLLMCMSNGSKIHLGKVALIEDEKKYAFGGFMGLVTPNESIDSKFLYYALSAQNYKDFINSLSAGANINNIKVRDLEKFVIPIPPLSEQQRIVSRLDASFAKIDALSKQAEEALEHAKALFQAKLKELMEKKEGWEEKKLGDVCRFFSGFAFKSNKFKEEGMPIIRISDIQNNKIDDSRVVYFNPKDYPQDLNRYIIYPGEIIIAMSGGTTGKIGKNETNKQFYLNQRVGAFRENKEILNHDFLYYYLQTKSEESLRIAAGAAQPNLSTAQINNYIIPLPSLGEQDRIANTLDSLSQKIQQLQQNYNQTLANCQALKQALLKETFE